MIFTQVAGHSSVIGHSTSMCKALGLISRTGKEQKKILTQIFGSTSHEILLSLEPKECVVINSQANRLGISSLCFTSISYWPLFCLSQ